MIFTLRDTLAEHDQDHSSDDDVHQVDHCQNEIEHKEFVGCQIDSRMEFVTVFAYLNCKENQSKKD
jgi:hypothetical protein